jgi:hypothetical protein
VKAYRCQEDHAGYHARIQVRMVNDAALSSWPAFGGHLYAERLNVLRVRQPLHCWSLSDAQAGAALGTLLPYLRVKRSVAETVLRLRRLQAEGQKHRTKIAGYRRFPNQHGTVRMVANRSFSDAYVARCEKLWSECRSLNHAPGWANSATA